MSRPRILVVDDDADILHLIGVRLRAMDYEVIETESGEEAIVQFRAQHPRLVITDLRMGGMDGLALFALLQAEAPTIPVIILTAHGSIPEAVSASQRGVFSFLTKPFDGQELLRRVHDALQISPPIDPKHESGCWRRDVVSASLRMDEVLRQALRISEEDRSALLIGPNGCGKQNLVQAIHQAGMRASGPLVTLACADYPAGDLEDCLLLNSEQNIFIRASTGVLHIRDVGALSALAQSRLFAVLFDQARAREPLHRLIVRGVEVPDVQIIASTPRPLDTAVAEGQFRSDLFYLLGGATVRIPPLSERIEDIPALATYFLSQISPDNRITLTPDAIFALQKARWTGNIRQLRSVLEQAASLTLTRSIPTALVSRVIRESGEQNLPAFDDARREFERDYLVQLLHTTGGNVSHAARVAQRNRSEFYKLLARHGLDPASFKQ